MKKILSLGLTLMAFCIIAGLSLGYINYLTADKISAQAEYARMSAIKEVLPDATIFEEKKAGEIKYNEGFADEGKTQSVGYVITAIGKGFSGDIVTIVGLKKDFTISAIEIVAQTETPGLGTRAVEVAEKGKEPWFETQYDGKSALLLVLDKDGGGDIKAITGATITSRAITKSIVSKAKELKENLSITGEDSTSAKQDTCSHPAEISLEEHAKCPHFKAHHPELADSLEKAKKESSAKGGSK